MPEEFQKQTLVDIKKVSSESLNKTEQSYKINYMEKTKKYMDKVRIYFFDRPPDKCTPRSLSILNPEELFTLIKDLTYSYFFLKEQRVKPELVMQMSLYRNNILLPDFIKEIREDSLKRWKG